MAGVIGYDLKGWIAQANPDLSAASIRQATKETLDFALATIKPRTPVDTGQLQNAWQKNYREVFNETLYAGYVEYGTERMEPRLMMTQSLPDIHAFAEGAMQRAASNWLNNIPGVSFFAARDYTPWRS